MRIRGVSAALLTTLIIISHLGCGRDSGDNGASPNGQNPLDSNSLSLTTNSENPLIGTWVSGEYSLTFKPDNTYSTDINRDGILEVGGRVTISGNVVIFTDAVGDNYYSQKDDGRVISGSYTYAICGNVLTFSPVLDLCRDRANILCLSYQKK
jgi:hypothetical protein